jgi:hypothetical protein
MTSQTTHNLLFAVYYSIHSLKKRKVKMYTGGLYIPPMKISLKMILVSKLSDIKFHDHFKLV